MPARPTRRTSPLGRTRDLPDVVNNFFSDAPYVAKCLWRDEMMRPVVLDVE